MKNIRFLPDLHAGTGIIYDIHVIDYDSMISNKMSDMSGDLIHKMSKMYTDIKRTTNRKDKIKNIYG